MGKAAYASLLGVLVFAPLAFGATEPWSWLVMEAAAFGALAMYGLHCHRHGITWYTVPGGVPLLVFLGYPALQMVPLPAALVGLVAPQTYALYEQSLGIVAPLSWLSLSINTKATASELLRYGAYAALYVVAVQLLAAKDALRSATRTIVALGGGIALFMMLYSFMPNGKIYWLREVGPMPTGPYVNHNHFANLMAMLLPVAVALFLHARPRVRYEKNLRAKVIAFFSYQRMSESVYLGLAALLIGAAIFLSLSRGGMTSSAVSVLLLFAVLFRRERAERKSGVLWGLLIAVAILFAVEWWFGWQHVFERFGRLRVPERGGIYELRFDYWQDTLRIIQDYWLTGVGFGGFVDIYPAYRTIAGSMLLDHAHNDYLELLVEGGLISMAMAGWFWSALFYQGVQAIRRRHERYSIYLFWGTAAGLVAFLLHGFTDFSIHLGANGLYFFFLGALLVAAAHTRLRPGYSPSLLPPTRFRRLPLLLGGSAAVLLVIGTTFQAGVVLGELRSKALRGFILDERLSQTELLTMKEGMEQAVQADPLSGEYWFALGNIEAALYNSEAARARYLEALQRNPANGLFLQQLAHAEAALGEPGKAERLFRASLHFERGEPDRYVNYAVWLWEMGRKAEGIEVMRQGLGLLAGRLDGPITLMIQHGLTDEEILAAMPGRMAPLLQLADYYNNAGKVEQAVRVYEQLLAIAPGEPRARAGYFHKPYWFFMKIGRVDRALAVMRTASELLPHDAAIAVYAAQAYEKQGLSYRALEEFQRALTIDPGHQAARQGVARLGNAPSR